MRSMISGVTIFDRSESSSRTREWEKWRFIENKIEMKVHWENELCEDDVVRKETIVCAYDWYHRREQS